MTLIQVLAGVALCSCHIPAAAFLQVQRHSRPITVGKLASSKEDPDEVIRSVFGKDLAFDDKTGRFFETPFSGDENKKGSADEKGVLEVFTKPKGTFFEDLQTNGFSLELPSFGGSSNENKQPKTPSAPSIDQNQDTSPASSGFKLDLPFGGSSNESEQATTPSVPSMNQNQDAAPVAAKTSAASAPKTPAPEAPSLSFFGDLFKPEEAPVEEALFEEVTIGPDFRVAAAFLLPGLLLDQIPYIQLTLGPIATLLGLLFLVQTLRIRFVFTEDNQFKLVNLKNPLTGEVEESGENLVVGGANIWDCDTIVNYEFFPAIDSSPVGPILVYFKETQTDSGSWSDGPGKLANDEAKIASGEVVPGQVHFFPCVCSADQINEEFSKRGCGKL